jgi:hypothetical protein
MMLQNWNTIRKTSQHPDSKEVADGSLTMPYRKGARQRNNPPINQHSENPTLKQDDWWATELFSRTRVQYTNSNCHTSLR